LRSTRALEFLAAWSVTLGCSAAPRPAERPASPARTRLTLPREFVARQPLVLRLTPARDEVTAERRVRLLRSPDAPAFFTLTLRPPRVCETFDGALDSLRVEAPSGAPFEAEARDGALLLRTTANGAADLEVRGEYLHGATGCDGGLAPGTRVPVRVRLHVDATDDPGRPRVGVCSGPFAGTEATVPLTLGLSSASDEELTFANLSPLAPFAVHVEADLPVTVAGPGMLGLAPRPGRVRLTAPGASEPQILRWRVPPEEVTDATVRLYVPGNAGTPAEVTEGALLTGSNRKLGGIFFEVRGARVGDARLCDRADARWFRLVSETPEVCAVVAVDPQGCDGCVGPAFGHQAARLLRDGVCSVRLEAPALDHGRGILRRVSARFESVAQFADVFPTLQGPERPTSHLPRRQYSAARSSRESTCGAEMNRPVAGST